MSAESAVIVGESLPMRRLREMIELAAHCNLPVLISGETGSGKELVARELHRRSGRSGLFVPVNACAPSEGMFEDAMFGHVRGAFTGALSDRAGYFAEANGGTLFLDEISGLSRDAQAKLLRVVETREFRPVGARRDASSDFRLVTASNEDLGTLVERGAFRADLAFRLQHIELQVPPLRERSEDIPLLVEHFVRLHSGAQEAWGRVSICALRSLSCHHWPGNVRELGYVVSRALAMTRGDATIDALALDRAWVRRARSDVPAEVGEGGSIIAVDSRRLLLDSLIRNGWDTRRTAAEFGVTRKTIYERMRRSGIRPRPSHGTSREFTPGAVIAGSPDGVPRSQPVGTS